MKTLLRAAAGMLALAMFPAVVACSGGDGSQRQADASTDPQQTPLVTPSTGGTAGGPSQALFGPASRYTPSEADLEGYYRADSANALVTNPDLYGRFGPFKNPKDGLNEASAWGYQEGYMVGFDPAGLLSAVIQGNYYITVEAHLFSTVEGAEKAYGQYVEFYSGTPGVESQSLAPLGNESSAWRALDEKLAPTNIDGVYHRFVWRRGNLVMQVETLGALPFMTADAARDVAVIMDDRALGQRPAPIPTPTGDLGQPR